MYNLWLPNLCATLLVAPLSLASACEMSATAPALYCAVPYIAACVDVRGTVLLGPFNLRTVKIGHCKSHITTKYQ